ncbi:hypothetical protein PHET_06765 [Paragonimus heterotremus]|uniref:Uncharacterized protein n=1 Tax=Paragonimus heterotremus TaxID=100268 RepID=A0A8J4SMU2_9TREM|nr:hypothetical protein PHET_06765 [Paragonimus heterotremus]
MSPSLCLNRRCPTCCTFTIIQRKTQGMQVPLEHHCFMRNVAPGNDIAVVHHSARLRVIHHRRRIPIFQKCGL